MTSPKQSYRPRGLGSIVQMPNGHWRAQASAGSTPGGDRRRITVTRKTKVEATAALKLMLREVAVGNVAPAVSNKTTVKDWAGEWLPIQQQERRPKTYLNYRTAITKWVVPTIGRRKLVELAPSDIRAVAAAMRKTGAASTTVSTFHTILIKMLRDAVAEGHTVPARVFAVKRPAMGASDRTALPLDQALAALKLAADDPGGSQWAAAFLQGLRQGERLGLTWQCVDLEAGVADVSWQLQALSYEHGCDGACSTRRAKDCPKRTLRVPYGYEFRQLRGTAALVRPKTTHGWRVIPLVPWMVSALETWREIAPGSPHDLVWPRADGEAMTAAADLAAWHALQDRAGLRHPSGRFWHVHEIRHTTATLLMSLGVDESVRIAILGHSSITVTRGYQHVDVEQARAALDAAATRLGLVG